MPVFLPAHLYGQLTVSPKPAVSEPAAETGSDHSAAGAPHLPHLHCQLALPELCFGGLLEPYGCCTAPGATASPQGPLVAWCSQQSFAQCPRRVSAARCCHAALLRVAPCTVAVRRSATACAQGLSAAMRHARRHTNSAGPHTQLEAATCRYLPGGAATHTSLSNLSSPTIKRKKY